MTYWNSDNTEGFSADDLEMLNEIQVELQAENPNIDAQNIADILNNAWVEGIDYDTLIEAARARL